VNYVPLDDFLPLVLPFARGASEPAAVAEVRSAAIEFCKRTKVWRELLEPQSIKAGSRDVDLPLPDGSDLVELAEVFYGRGNSGVIDPKSEDELRSMGVTPSSTGTPQWYTFYGDLYVMRIAPTPIVNESSALTPRAILMPARDADEVPDALFRRYGNEIAAGALARLHAYDEKWASNEKRREYGLQFEGAVGSVSHKVAKSNTRTKRRVTPSYF
jgi:hypothetical protein